MNAKQKYTAALTIIRQGLGESLETELKVQTNEAYIMDILRGHQQVIRSVMSKLHGAYIFSAHQYGAPKIYLHPELEWALVGTLTFSSASQAGVEVKSDGSNEQSFMVRRGWIHYSNRDVAKLVRQCVYELKAHDPLVIERHKRRALSSVNRRASFEANTVDSVVS